MDEQRYWFLARGEDKTRAETVISIPWWPETIKWVHEEGGERVAAPMLFSTRRRAQEELEDIERSEADSYLALVEQHGLEEVNEAYENTSPWRLYDIGLDSLLDKLEDSDFLCLMVDRQLRLRHDFAEELRKQLDE